MVIVASVCIFMDSFWLHQQCWEILALWVDLSALYSWSYSCLWFWWKSDAWDAWHNCLKYDCVVSMKSLQIPLFCWCQGILNYFMSSHSQHVWCASWRERNGRAPQKPFFLYRWQVLHCDLLQSRIWAFGRTLHISGADFHFPAQLLSCMVQPAQHFKCIAQPNSVLQFMLSALGSSQQ